MSIVDKGFIYAEILKPPSYVLHNYFSEVLYLLEFPNNYLPYFSIGRT